MGIEPSVYIGIGFIIITSMIFIFSAYTMSKRYYSPINNIVSIMPPSRTEGDEFDQIIDEIQNLIGERNGYREKMVTISPYARQGMLHGILNGNMEQERLEILSDNNFIDLKKPYFELILANIDYQGENQIRDIHYVDIVDIIQNVCANLSTEETQILCYIKDSKNLFLIINSEEEEELENKIFLLHNAILKEIDDESFMITFGVSKIQDNMNALKAACQEAMDALDNMLTGGRNAIYFYENSYTQDKKEYYFPKEATRRVAKALKDRNLADLRDFLDEIYKNNMDKYDSSPRTIRLLVDELHIVTLNALKTNTSLSTTQIQIDKMESNVTLEEIFRYYYVIYETICNQLEDLVTPNQDIEKLNQDIIDYINQNFKNADISLAHIGELFGVSNKYISLMCKNYLGSTYLQYIQDKRIEYASHLLQTTDFSLEQIAGMSGYSNMLTFRRNFKSIMGMNPSDYRK
ncbi:helix-turn-helix domain-containing protein [Konateibacter massiliensis]|uniref:helix-turn-helix domain-containing protein n=1 Tax=Konateibacter massiliensis TaxID=2002841 RepID=UPI000C1520DF|nr:response regulator transcription factor [Konateibacter massiliensis]